MKDRNKILFGLFFLFGILASMGLVMGATATLITPASSATLSGSGLLLNASIDDGTEGYVNATFYAKSTLTANSSWTQIGFFINDTAFVVNTTFNSAILEDANNYIFNVTFDNGTTKISDINTGITIDNTVPTTPSSLTPSDATVDSDGDVTFSATVTGSETTSCTLQFDGLLPPGGNAQSMTHTGNTCSLTLTAIPDQIYTWFVRASDETNTTDSSAIQINVDVQTSAGQAAILIQSGQAKSEGGASFSIIPGFGGLSSQQIIIGLLVIGGIIFFLKKKK